MAKKEDLNAVRAERDRLWHENRVLKLGLIQEGYTFEEPMFSEPKCKTIWSEKIAWEVYEIMKAFRKDTEKGPVALWRDEDEDIASKQRRKQNGEEGK